MEVDNIMHFTDYNRTSFTSHLIKDFSRVLQRLLRYFNGAIISTLCAIVAFSTVIFSLILNKLVAALITLKSTILPLTTFTAGSSLQYWQIIPRFGIIISIFY